MSMGRRTRELQGQMFIAVADLPATAGHPFYEKLNAALRAMEFDRRVEQLCEKFYKDSVGRPSIPPGVYFRLLPIGYFEGIDSERGIAWRVFNIVTTISLLLLVVTICFWIRSYFAFDNFYLSLLQFGDITADNGMSIATGKGGIRLEFQTYGGWNNGILLPQLHRLSTTHITVARTFYPEQLNPYGPDIHGFSWHGFEHLTYRYPVPKGMGSGTAVLYQTYFLAPLWALSMLWAILPVIYWTFIRKRRRIATRIAKGLCLVCGYDLRSHSPGQRCPECGTEIVAKATVSPHAA